MYDFDDLLSGRDRLHDVFAERSLLHATQEVTGDRKVDVGFEQHAPYFTQTLADHGLGQNPALTELAEHPVEFLTQFFKHDALETAE